MEFGCLKIAYLALEFATLPETGTGGNHSSNSSVSPNFSPSPGLRPRYVVLPPMLLSLRGAQGNRFRIAPRTMMWFHPVPVSERVASRRAR
jgi:hypothetical protein